MDNYIRVGDYFKVDGKVFIVYDIIPNDDGSYHTHLVPIKKEELYYEDKEGQMVINLNYEGGY